MRRLLTILLCALTIPILHATTTPYPHTNDHYLKKNIKKLNRGKPLSEKTTTRMLKIACAHPSPQKALHTTKHLLETLQQKKYPFNKHHVFCHALQYANPSLIEYLLQQKIHHPELLTKQVRYDLVYKTSFDRLNENFNKLKILPKIVRRAITIISYTATALFFISLILRNLRTISKEITNTSVTIASFLPIISGIKVLVILYYGFYKLGIQPNYLIITLKTNRSRKDKTAIILLLLKYGAHPHLQSLYITPTLTKQEDSATEIIRRKYHPSRYEFIYPIHLAVQQGLLEVVQALEAQGADLNALAFYIEDAVNTSGIQPETDLVLFTEIYKRKGRHVTCKSLLDIAPYGPTYQYLRKKKVKKYRGPGAQKKKAPTKLPLSKTLQLKKLFST